MIMAAKGLLARDESRRSHVYRPQAPADKTQRQPVVNLMAVVLSRLGLKLVMQALSSKNVSRADFPRSCACWTKMERGTP